ncbi:MAG TPA: hypothetical protein VKR52_04670 [Terracidiphilus sp.]|nr:hypothetical protein [Terracidiphilus sp.]
MSERKTNTVTTPSNHAVELKDYITAGEFLDLNEESEKSGLTKTALAKKILELAVVSIDGAKENIPSAIRELPIADYTFLQQEIKKLIEGNFTVAKNPQN